MSSKRIRYKEIYELFDTLTPLRSNCGQLCDAACCKSRSIKSEDMMSDDTDGLSGMLLFLGEEEFFAGKDGYSIRESTSDNRSIRRVLVCEGTCHREERPLACRIFPLFPLLTESGRIRVVYDPRAFAVCPLVRSNIAVRCQPAFVRAVGIMGRRLAGTAEGRLFLQQQTAELLELSRFLPLDRQRPPIARRSLRKSK